MAERARIAPPEAIEGAGGRDDPRWPHVLARAAAPGAHRGAASRPCDGALTRRGDQDRTGPRPDREPDAGHARAPPRSAGTAAPRRRSANQAARTARADR